MVVSEQVGIVESVIDIYIVGSSIDWLSALRFLLSFTVSEISKRESAALRFGEQSREPLVPTEDTTKVLENILEAVNLRPLVDEKRACCRPVNDGSGADEL